MTDHQCQDAADSTALGTMLLAQIFSRNKVTVTGTTQKNQFCLVNVKPKAERLKHLSFILQTLCMGPIHMLKDKTVSLTSCEIRTSARGKSNNKIHCPALHIQ